jgi:hypothetical protein
MSIILIETRVLSPMGRTFHEGHSIDRRRCHFGGYLAELADDVLVLAASADSRIDTSAYQ